MLLAFWEVQRLTREINALERRAIETRTRLSHYQKYAGRLGASGVMNGANIAGLSAELIPRATMFAQYSNQASSMSAMQNLQMQKAMGLVPILNNPQSQAMMEMSAFARFKEESMKALKQQEADVLSEVEAEIQLELNSIETQIKEKQAMKESTQQLLSKEVTENVPKFGLG